MERCDGDIGVGGDSPIKEVKGEGVREGEREIKGREESERNHNTHFRKRNTEVKGGVSL